MRSLKKETAKLNAKRVFMKKGTCSRTFFFILDREFGNVMDNEERSVDPLAGGILQQGYQCGMLWGAAMAVGAEAYRRNKNKQAISLAIKSTQCLLESFENRATSIECSYITNCEMAKKGGLLKFFLTGKFTGCFKLAGKWGPEAIESAKDGLSSERSDLPQNALSCASELIKQMGGNEKEIHMVAGLAGGLGLSGSGCGALAAAVWLNTLEWNRKENRKNGATNPNTNNILYSFYSETNYKMECKEICGKKFNSIYDHTEFIKKGGCSKLIKVLSESSSVK